MEQVLLVIPSEDMRIGLEELLQNTFQVTSCSSGLTALHILENQSPDILVVDLELPELDGLSLLAEAGCHVPRRVLALSTSPSHYVHQTSYDHGVDLILLKPCSIRCIVQHINRLNRLEYPNVKNGYDPQMLTSSYLIELGIPQNLTGFKHLKIGIPLYAQNSTQKETKELFPSISKLTGHYTPAQIERSIRVAIQAGVKHGNPKAWKKYFPLEPDGSLRVPTSKQFIARLAEKLTEKCYFKKPA